MPETLIILLGSILFLSLICQWLAWWVNLPAILFLLVAGVLVGPVLGWLHPDQIFGQLLTPLIDIAVAVILFEGSLSLNFKKIKGHMHVVGYLLTLGVFITLVCSTFLAHWLFQLPLRVSLLFAVIISVSGPTVVAPLLHSVRPKEKVANILHWEGIVVDPIVVLLAVLVFNFITVSHAHTQVTHILFLFLIRIAVSASIGVCIAYLCGLILRYRWLPEYLHNVGVLAFVVLVFALGNYLEPGSGLLSILVMGLFLTNMDGIDIDHILDFKESLSVLLISGVFLVLAARINFTRFEAVVWSALLFVGCLQFVVRPLAVWLCTFRSGLKFQEKVLLAWIYPRGIVAAAVSAVFAIRLKGMHLAGHDSLELLTFLVIIGTVCFQSVTAKPLALLLGVVEEKRKGFLVIGANPVARAIASALAAQHVRVCLVSAAWEYVQAARMAQLPVFYGSAISEYADRHLDLMGLSGMLALTKRTDYNALSALRFKRIFGQENIFSVQTMLNENEKHDKHSAAQRYKGQLLFAEGVTFSKLQAFMDAGAEIKATRLSESYCYQDFETKNPEAVLLFGLDAKNRLHFFTKTNLLKPQKGWVLVSLNR